MKKSPQDTEVYNNLSSSKFSGDGFLGEDKRSFEEIVASDKAVLDKLDITNDQIASHLEAVFDKARCALGAEVEIKPGITATYHESMGKIPSPFKGEGTFEKGEVVVTDWNKDIKIIITRLGIHLIRKHGFFQGLGARYRIDPEAAVNMLF